MSSTGDTAPKEGEVREKTMKIKVEFTGGLELLFANQSSYTFHLPTATTATPGSTRPYTIADLISHLVGNVMVDSRRELFVLESSPAPPPHSVTTGGVTEGSRPPQYTIRPGILVLINDADWELEGEERYELRDGDGVLFVSTLHGG